MSCSYFEGGFSSVYLWDIDDVSFAGCFLIQKGSHTAAAFMGSAC